MGIYKCKICGADLNRKEGFNTCECSFCHKNQTISPSTDQEVLSSIVKGNLLRNSNEFNKAYSLFNQLIVDGKADAEVYWNIVLCKYGITYVDDCNGNKTPTINRINNVPINDDEDFIKCIELADSTSREQYKIEANEINNIQKAIENENHAADSADGQKEQLNEVHDLINECDFEDSNSKTGKSRYKELKCQYADAIDCKLNGEYDKAIRIFEDLKDFEDSSQQKNETEELLKKKSALTLLKANLKHKYISANKFKNISDKIKPYLGKKDSSFDDLFLELKKKQKKTRRNIFLLISSAVFTTTLISLSYFSFTSFIPNNKYNDGVDDLIRKDLDSAVLKLDELNYKDSNDLLEFAKSIKSNDYHEIFKTADEINLQLISPEFKINKAFHYDSSLLENINSNGVDTYLTNIFLDLNDSSITAYGIENWRMYNLEFALVGDDHLKQASMELIPEIYTKNYSINYDLNGGAFANDRVNYKYNIHSCFKLVSGKKEGYTFKYWLDESNNEIVDEINPSKNNILKNLNLKAYYEINKYEVSVDVNSSEGTVTGNGIYDYNSRVQLRAIPELGFIFIGWYDLTKEDFISSQSEFVFEMNAENITLKAVFQKSKLIISLDTYNITKDIYSSGGKAFGYGQYLYGDDITIIAIPDTNYCFEGWYKEDILISNESTYKIPCCKSNLSLTAKFKIKPHITLKSNNPSFVNLEGEGYYNIGDQANIKAIFSNNLIFKGWYNEQSELISTFESYTFTVEEKNYTLIAKVESKDYHRYGISIEPGQEHMGSISIASASSPEYIQVIAKPNDGYIFNCWYFYYAPNQLDYSHPRDFNPVINLLVDHYFQCLASFREKPQVKLAIATGQEKMGTISGEGKFDEGENVTIIAKPNTNYDFVGWYDNGKLISTHSIYTFTMGKYDLFYEASFSQSPTLIISTAKGQEKMGDIEGGGVFPSGDLVIIKAIPKPKCYFNGWYLNNEIFSHDLTCSFVISNDIHLEARFSDILDDHSFIKLGAYPQSLIKNKNLIKELTNEITNKIAFLRKISEHYVNCNAYFANDFSYVDFSYNGEKYRGIRADIDNGSIKKNTWYFFIYMDITWKIINENGTLISNRILDKGQCIYNNKITEGRIHGSEPSNYEYSDLRKWLNTKFIDIAFSSEEKQNIILTTEIVTNRSNNTFDKVFIPRPNFDETLTIICDGATTDYAIDDGWVNRDVFNDRCFYYCLKNWDYSMLAAVDNYEFGIRPSIRIDFSEYEGGL